MGRLLTVLGFDDNQQSMFPKEVLDAEQFVIAMQIVYEQSPESYKKDILASAIAENTRLLMQAARGSATAIPQAPPSDKPIPSTDPSTWNGVFNIGDRVRIRIDMSMNVGVKYDSPNNDFIIVNTDLINAIRRPENPSGLTYFLNSGSAWEGKDLELIERGAGTPPQPKPEQPEEEQPEPEQPEEEQPEEEQPQQQPTPPAPPKKPRKKREPRQPKAPQRPSSNDEETQRRIEELENEKSEIEDALFAFDSSDPEYQELNDELTRINNELNNLR